jgi:hypothetical protein
MLQDGWIGRYDAKPDQCQLRSVFSRYLQTCLSIKPPRLWQMKTIGQLLSYILLPAAM